MKVDNLIDGLTADLQPIQALPHPFSRALLWILGGVLYLVGFVLIMALRADVGIMIVEPAAITELVFSLSLFLSGAFASAWLSVPDKRGQPWVGRLPVIFGVGFGLWIAGRAFADPGEIMPHLDLHHCMGTCVLAGFGPALLIGWASHKGATTAPILMAVANILFVTGIGLIGLKLTCDDDSVGHMLLMHLGPFILAGFLIGLLARRLYRW